MKIKKLAVLAVSALFCVNLCSCAPKPADYTDYVKGVLDCKYSGDTQSYMKATGATYDEAHKLYEAHTDVMTRLICFTYNIDEESVNGGVMTGYGHIARTVLKKASYTVGEPVKEDGKYKVDITIQPIDFWDITEEPVQKYIDGEFADTMNSRYSGHAAANEQVMAFAETEYAIGVQKIIEALVDDISYKEPETVTVEFEAGNDSFGLSDDEWREIDMKILDIGTGDE